MLCQFLIILRLSKCCCTSDILKAAKIKFWFLHFFRCLEMDSGNNVSRLWSQRWRISCRSIRYNVFRHWTETALCLTSLKVKEFETALFLWIYYHLRSLIWYQCRFFPRQHWQLQFLAKQHKYCVEVLSITYLSQSNKVNLRNSATCFGCVISLRNRRSCYQRFFREYF